jgi:hypothetical protein
MEVSSLSPASRAAKFVQLVALGRWVLFILGLHMLDDNKRTHALKLWFTEREYVELCKYADDQDRKNSEAARVIVRRFMFGNVGTVPSEVHGSNRPGESAE